MRDIAIDLTNFRVKIEHARRVLENVQELEAGEPLKSLVARLEEIAAGVARVEGILEGRKTIECPPR